MGGVASDAVVAVIDIDVELSSAGTDAHVDGFGVGGSVSGGGSVVALAGAETVPVLLRASRIWTVYVYCVEAVRPVSV